MAVSTTQEAVDSNNSEGNAIAQQLDAMSQRLDRLLSQLSRQREESKTVAEKKHYNQLRKDIKKQATAVMKLQDSMEDIMTTLAKSAEVLDKLDATEDGASRQTNVATGDVNGMLFQIIAKPFQGGKHRLVMPVQQRNYWNLEIGKKLKLLRRMKKASMDTRGNAHPEVEENENIRPLSTSNSGTTASEGPYTNESTNESTNEVVPSVSVPSSIQDEPILPAVDEEPELETDHDDVSNSSNQSNISSRSSLSSSISSPHISVQDWRNEAPHITLSIDTTCLSAVPPPLGSAAIPPPLPRKSSRRTAHTPRVPSLVKRKPVPSRSPTPASSVDGDFSSTASIYDAGESNVEAGAGSGSISGAGSSSVSVKSMSSSTSNNSASSVVELLSTLEKRYSLTMPVSTMTPTSVPVTP